MRNHFLRHILKHRHSAARRWFATSAAIAVLTTPALAHTTPGQAQGFVTGFLHPLSGLDHVLAMIAVGIWGAQLKRPAIWILPVAFPLVMSFGGLLGIRGVPLPGVEIGVAASAVGRGFDRVGLRNFSRTRARHRITQGGRAAHLRSGLRSGDRPSSPVRNPDWAGRLATRRKQTASHRWRIDRRDWTLSSCSAGDARMSAIKKTIVVAASFVALAPLPAFAHPMQGVGDFYAGMLHPVITLETVLPMIALGLLAGQQRREDAIQLLAMFPAALIAGAVLATLGKAPSALGLVQLILTAGLGILVASARRVPSWFLVALGVVLGISAGWANATEVFGQVSPLRFVAGLAVVGLLLLVYGNGLVRNLKVEWTQIAVRVVGSWIAAASILVLGLR
jgi:hydrogenase/urease accessory protein HupE